jgi:type IV fimbrial biogenesis protein FimT
MHGHSGFTLLEMLLVVALLSIGAMLAAPAFGELLRDTRRAATINTLAHALHGARTAAATSGRAIRLCGTRDGRSCSGELRWSPVLLLRPAVDDDPALTRLVALPAGSGAPSVHSNRAWIEIAPLAPAATTATLTVCDDRGAEAARALIVSRTGRSRISARSASGTLLSCP